MSHQTDLNKRREERQEVQKNLLVEHDTVGGEQKLQKNPLVGHGVEKDKRLNLRIIHQTDLSTGGGERQAESEEEKGRESRRIFWYW